MRYEIKVTFGEIFLKLCQTNWNVAIYNVNVVVDELHLFNNWYLDSTRINNGFMRFSAIRPKWQASSEIGVKSFQLYYGHP